MSGGGWEDVLMMTKTTTVVCSGFGCCYGIYIGLNGEDDDE